jgi:hypothetical protein
MPEKKTEQEIAENAESLATSLLGACGQVGTTNPLRKSLSGKFRIVGIVTRENGETVSGISIGLMGAECRTDQEGRFELLIEKK